MATDPQNIDTAPENLPDLGDDLHLDDSLVDDLRNQPVLWRAEAEQLEAEANRLEAGGTFSDVLRVGELREQAANLHQQAGVLDPSDDPDADLRFDGDAQAQSSGQAQGQSPAAPAPTAPAPGTTTPFIDSDSDGLSDDVERQLGTNPSNRDTDGDGWGDGYEVSQGSPGGTVGGWSGPRVRDLRVADTADVARMEAERVTRIEQRMGVQHNEDADGDGFADWVEHERGTDPNVSDLTPAQVTDNLSPLDRFLEAAQSQTGKPYKYGAESDPYDPDGAPAYDSSELVEWAARQAGIESIPDGSVEQYKFLADAHATISVDAALQTKGALVFGFSSDPLAPDRPARAYVGISLGNGKVLDVSERAGVVREMDPGGFYTHAAMIPELHTPSGDLDGDGVPDLDEYLMGGDITKGIVKPSPTPTPVPTPTPDGDKSDDSDGSDGTTTPPPSDTDRSATPPSDTDRSATPPSDTDDATTPPSDADSSTLPPGDPTDQGDSDNPDASDDPVDPDTDPLGAGSYEDSQDSSAAEPLTVTPPAFDGPSDSQSYDESPSYSDQSDAGPTDYGDSAGPDDSVGDQPSYDDSGYADDESDPSSDDAYDPSTTYD